jgi:hypothetical protein
MPNGTGLVTRKPIRATGDEPSLHQPVNSAWHLDVLGETPA